MLRMAGVGVVERGERAVPLRQLHRVRWAVRACLSLGVAASVAANVLHAQPNPIAQAIAAWPPLALLLTVELISRVPVHRRTLAAVRLAATAAIAGIAAWVSYWHMAGVAARYGEAGAAPYLLPLSVDGLVVVASVSLVELAGRIRAAQQDQEEHLRRRGAAPEAAGPAVENSLAPGAAPAAPGSASLVEAKPLGALVGERLASNRPRARTSPANSPSRPASTARVPASRRPANAAPANAAPGKRGRPVAETRRLAAELAAEQPDATPDDIARELGITTTRLKRVLAA
jgi:Protein of unknown function (DUF2637)